MIEREVYADGQVDDGRVLPLPNLPEIAFQHLLTRDMQSKGHGTVIMEDPARDGVMLTIGQVYDLYSLTLLVIGEVEARAKKEPA